MCTLNFHVHDCIRTVEMYAVKLQLHPQSITHLLKHSIAHKSTPTPKPNKRLAKTPKHVRYEPRSLQFIQVLQPRQHNLLTRLLNLTRQKHLVENRIHLNTHKTLAHIITPPQNSSPPSPTPLSRTERTNLVKIKNQIQLTNIPEKRIQNLYEEMQRLQRRKLIIRLIHSRTKE